MSHVCPHCDITVDTAAPSLEDLTACLRATLAEMKPSAPPLPTPTEEER